MKFVSGIIGLCWLVAACSSPQRKTATLFETISARQPGSSHYLVFVINPNDCVNCLVGFRHLAATLQQRPRHDAACFVVLPETRSVERPGILGHTLKNIDTTRFHLLWNDQRYAELLAQCGTKLHASSLCAYDADGKVFFTARVQALTGLEKELRGVMGPGVASLSSSAR